MLFLYLPVFLAKDYWEAEPDKKESMRNIFKGFSIKKAKICVSLELVEPLIFLRTLKQIGFAETIVLG